MIKMAHVSEDKKKLVARFVKLINDNSVVGAIDIEGMPAAQLQKMRETLRDNDIELIVAKRRIIKHALEQAKESKKGIEQLEEFLKGMPALIFSKLDSFKLYKLLKSSKSEAPAKAGQTAPKDIVVKAGPTPFLPGPIISELGAVGLKSGVEDGKVAIKEDAVVAKEGDVITAELAGLLTRLDIKPMEIGLNLTASLEDGTIFKKDVLDVDEEQFIADITRLAQESFNLSVEAGYLTKDNVEIVLNKVFRECKAVAEESGFLADVVVEDMLAKAEGSAKSLKSAANIPDEVPKEEPKAEEKPAEVKEEPKVEEKKEEKPTEAPKAEEKPTEVKEELKPVEPQPQETKEEAKEEKVLEEEKEIIKEESKLEEPVKEEQAPVEKEVKEAVKEEEEKVLEKERIEKEAEVEKIEEEKPKETPSTDDKIAKMVQQQQKHASGEDKKESAEALVEEVKEESKSEKEKKEVEEVENLVAQLKKGQPLQPKTNSDDVPSLSDLAKRKK
jgi:large subunit ribosomal protein L10